MDAMLSTSEVAELTGISLRHVKRLAASNKLPCEKTVNSNNRPKYLFPLSGLAALDPTLPQRYLAQHAQEGTAEGAAEPQNAKRGRGRPRKGGAGKTAASKPLEEYSTEERGEIAFWTQAVQDWRGYRAGYRDKAAADEAWLAQFRLDHPEVHITRKILYARQRAVLEDDLDGLVDGRGKARRGYCKIPAAAWDAFMYYYLDQRQSPIKQCYDQTIYFLEQHCPEALPVPDYTTFYRHVMADVPEPVKVMGREGPKAFYDRCSHYIRREYENMQSNEYWIADTHTFDVVTKGDGGGTHRLYLTAFMDARSGIFVGCHVADTNSSQNVLTALRRGILRYGIPDNIYVDNGREYLNKDVGGTGHRTRKTKNEWQGWDDTEKFVPPPVFTRLGIKMTNAIVRNARAKTIERRFCDVKNQISRLFDTFCGGTVVEKPEQLKHLLKGGEVWPHGQPHHFGRERAAVHRGTAAGACRRQRARRDLQRAALHAVRGRAGAEPVGKRRPHLQAPHFDEPRNRRRQKPEEQPDPPAGAAKRIRQVLQGNGPAHAHRAPANGRLWPQRGEQGGVGV